MPNTRRSCTDRERFWHDLIAAWKTAGQLIRAFCAARGVSDVTFFARRRELADQEQLLPRAGTVPLPPFAAVRVIPDPAIEIVLPGGLVLRGPTGTDPAAVARLVAALGGVRCWPSG